MPHEPAVRSQRRPESVSIIAPTYNERDNIRRFVTTLAATMGDSRWELIVVDDDSPDRTYEAVEDCAREGWPVRCIRRIGRRGLASAVVEGALASLADCLVVMDADLQHDETALPALLAPILAGEADLAIASRYVAGGGVGEWDASRRRLSSVATSVSQMLVGSGITDPMSGFFAIRRDVFLEEVHDLSQQGYKILLDLISSASRPLRIVEIPYAFRVREAGTTKLDLTVGVEFVLMLVDKLSMGLAPPKLVLFLIVGLLGLGCHLAVLEAARSEGLGFMQAQLVATVLAMTFNYVLNNNLTYRRERLRGLDFLAGYVVFCLICALGVVANITVANAIILHDDNWRVAGLAGALMSAVFNYQAASRLVWGSGGRGRRRRKVATAVARLIGGRAGVRGAANAVGSRSYRVGDAARP
jgi:dolichol-phosphate mannosyltransferase